MRRGKHPLYYVTNLDTERHLKLETRDPDKRLAENSSTAHYRVWPSSGSLGRRSLQFYLNAMFYLNQNWTEFDRYSNLHTNVVFTAPFRCLAAMPPEGCTRVGILPGCPSLDRGSREAEVGFEPWTFRSVNSRSNPWIISHQRLVSSVSNKKTSGWCLLETGIRSFLPKKNDLKHQGHSILSRILTGRTASEVPEHNAFFVFLDFRKCVNIRRALQKLLHTKQLIDEMMRRTLEGLQDPGVQIPSDEKLAHLEYADDTVVVFEGEKVQLLWMN
ncbi:hypothetical protein T265_09126 [Opisthorchis viverrini]|uniref:Reverse transcriptase domain-containing protein n=1 Tax=Opisthorchis viverrini TaxID=6198 RepID=A0A074ZHU3_OPIVI|nr:hypothetical protein T265_09126 [Opisthorchis viverrini]KER22850.1 hypothetical protein T265_09126 [Opisthorchis viverrini]